MQSGYLWGSKQQALLTDWMWGAGEREKGNGGPPVFVLINWKEGNCCPLGYGRWGADLEGENARSTVWVMLSLEFLWAVQAEM